jgi:hypothetical protein
MNLNKFTKGLAALALTATVFSGSSLLDASVEAKGDKEVLPITSVEYTGKNSNFVNKNKEKLIESMDEIGVKKSKQKGLLQKIADGKLPDSENPEKVKEAEESLTLDSANSSKTHVFEDGSVMKVSITPPKDEKLASVTGPQAVEGPQAASCGTGYCNFYEYEISATTAFYKAKATASWAIVYGDGNADKVTDIKRLYVTMFHGTHDPDSKYYSIPKPFENVYDDVDAYGYAGFLATSWGNFYGANKKLRLYVGDDSYTVTSY